MRGFCFLLVSLLCAAASAAELRFLAGADFYLTNSPLDATLFDGEFGLSVRGQARDLGGRVDLKLDYVDREAIFGNTPRHELHELSVRVKNLGRRVDLTAGRFLAPNGFWLFVDGAAARVRLPLGLSAEVYGGLRAFTNGRAEADLRPDPLLLPLVGMAVNFDDALVHWVICYTYTQDVLDLHRGLRPDGGDYVRDGSTTGMERVARPRAAEHFLDAHVLVLPHPKLFFQGGFSLGARYEVIYSSVSTQIGAPPIIDSMPMRAVTGFLVLEWRPLKRVRLSASVLYDRIKVASEASPLDGTTPVPSGSFLDNTLKANVRLWRMLGTTGRYRLRLRDNGDVVHRVDLSVQGDRLFYGLGLFASFGGDFYQSSRPVGRDGLVAQSSVVSSAGLSYEKKQATVRAGLSYTDAVGPVFGYSTLLAEAIGEGPQSTLSPLTQEGQRFAFLRTFLTLGHVFAGLDAELGLTGTHFRLLSQVGYAQ